MTEEPTPLPADGSADPDSEAGGPPVSSGDGGAPGQGGHALIAWFKKVKARWTAVKVWFGRLVLIILRAPTDVFEEDGSRWPSSYKQFIWDLVPGELAQGSDGVVPPPEDAERLAWTNDVKDADVPNMYSVARAYRKDSDDTARNIELKASRLATVLVALLTANAALVVFELTRLGSDPTTLQAWLVATSAGFGLWSAGWLIVGLTRAVDADQRMGITTVSKLSDVTTNPRAALRDEAHGREVSNWTRRKKADRLIDARAAVSRSMLRLVISAVIAMILTVNNTTGDDAPDKDPTDNATHTPGTSSLTTPSTTGTLASPSTAPTRAVSTTPTPTKKPAVPPSAGATP